MRLIKRVIIILAIALFRIVTPNFFIRRKRRTALVIRNPTKLATPTYTATIARTKRAFVILLGPGTISASAEISFLAFRMRAKPKPIKRRARRLGKRSGPGWPFSRAG
jgi:hypothetical protein